MSEEKEPVYVQVTAGSIRGDVLCEDIPGTCCGKKLESGYGYAGGGLGVYYYCTGKCERIYKRKQDIEPEEKEND